MSKTISEQLRFPPVSGMSVRAAFDGGALSSDFGVLLLAGVDRQMGLTERLTVSFTDRRHASYVDHALADLLKQRIYQQASAYEDCNDAGVSEPKVFVLDMDHTDDPTYGQQQSSFYNHHYRNHCYLPLTIFDGLSGQLVTAILRPGKRPTGRENAMIMKRVTDRIRKSWPHTHIILRGDGHFSNPELMRLCLEDGNMDFIFGLPSNQVLNRMGAPLMRKASTLHAYRQHLAKGETISNPFV